MVLLKKTKTHPSPLPEYVFSAGPLLLSKREEGKANTERPAALSQMLSSEGTGFCSFCHQCIPSPGQHP